MAWSAIKIWLALGLTLLLEGVMPGTWLRPDAVLLFLVPLALRTNRYWGAVVGFGGGILLGAIGGSIAGTLALTYGVIGYLLGWWGEREVPGFFVELLGMIFALASVEVILGAFLRLLPWSLGPSLSVLRDWLPQALLVNIVLLWPFEALVRSILGRVRREKLNWHV